MIYIEDAQVIYKKCLQ